MRRLSGRPDEYERVVDGVTRVLAGLDPMTIGEGSEGFPADEYESEAREIVRRLLHTDVTKTSVLDVVRDVFADHFGANDVPSNEILEDAAAEITALVERR
jgi:hypothetical protein